MQLGCPKQQSPITDQDLGRATMWIGFASLGFFAIGCAAILWDIVSYTAA